jgi:RNA polymerase sigma-70 factor (ECF subfamily)
MENRTNEQWMADLRSQGTVYDAALVDLRTVILAGLPYLLSGWLPAGSETFEALAEEVTQETLLKVTEHLDAFEGRSQFTTWVYKIATRTALTELRRRRWKDASLESLLEGEVTRASPAILQEPGPSPEEAAERADLMMRLKQVMQEELTEKQMLGITLVALRGISMEETARRLGMERNALYKLLHDARLRLKHRMAREGLDPEEILAMFARS